MPDQERIGLDNLQPPPGSRSARKRRGRGRGSGLGKTSGRGHKGQKSRSGASIPAWFEGGQMPLYRRTPKRGFKPHRRTEWVVVNLDSLDRMESDEAVDPEALIAAGVVGVNAKGMKGKKLKILGRGEIARALVVRAHAFSASARDKIVAAGGRAEVID